MKAQDLLKIQFKGIAIKSDRQIVGMKSTNNHDDCDCDCGCGGGGNCDP
jgi:hypothetical protein